MAASHVAPLHGLAQPEPTATIGAETTVATTPLEVSADWRLDEDARMPLPVVRLVLALAAAVSLANAMVASTETEAAVIVMVTADDDTPAPLATASRIWFFLAAS